MWRLHDIPCCKSQFNLLANAPIFLNFCFFSTVVFLIMWSSLIQSKAYATNQITPPWIWSGFGWCESFYFSSILFMDPTWSEDSTASLAQELIPTVSWITKKILETDWWDVLLLNHCHFHLAYSTITFLKCVDIFPTPKSNTHTLNHAVNTKAQMFFSEFPQNSKPPISLNPKINLNFKRKNSQSIIFTVHCVPCWWLSGFSTVLGKEKI